MATRLERLLGDFQWGRMDEIFLADRAVRDMSELTPGTLAKPAPKSA